MTPIWSQYLRIKRQYPHAILFFRLGDFYETFNEDAELVARELEITLTSRPMGKGKRVPLAGVPYHAVESYLSKLISRGYKVAICEQVGDPKTSRGIVEREVVRVVTPGTVIESNMLSGAANNFLVALSVDGDSAGLAYVDVTTSEFATAQMPLKAALSEMERLGPAELLLPQDTDWPEDGSNVPVTRLDSKWFETSEAQDILLNHFGVATLEGYGCQGLPLAVAAAGAVVRYLEETQKSFLPQITGLRTYSVDSFMALDPSTRRNLELFQSGRSGAAKGSLLSALDLTRTPMGSRLLRRWLSQPLLDIDELILRQDGVERFFAAATTRSQVRTLLGEIADMERLINRARGGVAAPREMVALKRSLEGAAKLRETSRGPFADDMISGLKAPDEVVDLIAQAIAGDPPASITDGGAIKAGFSPELDAIRGASRDAREYLAQLETYERDRTGIKSLKVGYNRVFGYYIEVSNSYRDHVPQDYIRRQTLTGAERYYTPQLKEHELAILSAQERSQELEAQLYRQVCAQIAVWGEVILETAGAVAKIDVFSALAEAAVRHGYTRPRLNRDDTIDIVGGRHPVVELSLSEGGGALRHAQDSAFVPNDTRLSNGETQIAVITGPNMSGKSTYLRQVAIIVLMAQVGSYVPADSATIGLVDRIFTRVGAQDDLARGESTFMVEMVETANILNHATPRSLIILDEIGRGTSTYDGISIARAVVEYLHNHPRLGAKTLFATHYHELTELAKTLPRVRNFNFAVVEEDGKVVFLRKILPGGADKSYGIHVAQLAGLPPSVINRAQEALRELEGSRDSQSRATGGRLGGRRGNPDADAGQLALFGAPSPDQEELASLDISNMTPLEAINKLYELQQRARGEADKRYRSW